MEDLFTEMDVTKARTPLTYLAQGLLIVVTVLLFAAGFFIFPYLLLGGLVMIYVDRWLFKKFHVEWEYSYVNGELDIAKIFSKESRKHIATYVVKDAELFAQVNSDAMNPYRELPVKDYTAGTKEARSSAYALVYRTSGESYTVLLSPNDQMINDIRVRMPGKTVISGR